MVRHMAARQRTDYSVDDPALVTQIEEGLPVIDVVAFGREAGFTAEEMADLIQIPSRTYSRRVAARGKLKLDEGDRAVRIMRLYDKARKVFTTHELARQWLNQPLPVLNWRTPLAYARSELGAREVEAVLGRIEHGVFS